MQVLFQNHSSLLIKNDENYVLLDPWYNQPAFGSWLPSVAPYIHPTYLASLKDKLTVLISHGHDDHFDDRLLSIFDKNTKIITAKFKSPSVINRLRRLGFNNVVSIGEDETEVNGLIYSSYIVESFSHDDAVYLIRNRDGAVIHANDNWHEFDSTHEKLMLNRTAQYEKKSILLFTQTNSASGYPLNYINFTKDEQDKLLREKVAKMVYGGISNAKKLGLDRVFSYAGYATPYVKGMGYETRSLFPTSKFLTSLLEEEGFKSEVKIEDLMPGDYIDLPSGNIVRAFVTGYNDIDIRQVTSDFYSVYGNINECISYKNVEIESSSINNWLEDFLTELNDFSVRRVSGPDSHFDKLLGKSLTINVEHDGEIISKSIEFGKGLISTNEKTNKQCFVSSSAMYQVLLGNSLFEDLYTGYNATWKRSPKNSYNRDIVMMIVMFSYVYKNRLAATYIDKYKASK